MSSVKKFVWDDVSKAKAMKLGYDRVDYDTVLVEKDKKNNTAEAGFFCCWKCSTSFPKKEATIVHYFAYSEGDQMAHWPNRNRGLLQNICYEVKIIDPRCKKQVAGATARAEEIWANI